MNRYAFAAGVQAGMNMAEQPAANTDTLLWREKDGDYYSPTISRTQEGRIAINVGGSVYEKTLTEWHELAGGAIKGRLG